MENEILKVLEKSEKSLDAIEIIKRIMPSYTAKDLNKLLNTLDKMCDEALIVQRKDSAYMPFERSKFLKGTIDITSRGNGFLLLENKDLHIKKDRLKGALNGDIVICEVVDDNGKEYEGRVKKILERNLHGGLAEIYLDENGCIQAKLCDESLPFLIELEDIENTNLVEGEIVKLNVIKEVSHTLYCNIKSKVCHKNQPDADTLMVIAEFNIPIEFSAEALKEVENIPNKVLDSDMNGRRDLRNEEIFTIDGIDTKDIDDAISLSFLPNGNYLLGVHIADVSHYVKDGSKLNEDALARGNSVYLADRVIPMLPIELSNGICSLNPGVDRCAVTCMMEIDSLGNIINKDLFKSIIRSRKKMNYDSVNKVFAGECEEEYKEYESSLNKMLELSRILKKNKQDRGEIDFISSEVKLVVDNDGKVIEVKKRTEGLGENMIEDFMIAANESVSKTMTEKGVPTIYRVHGTPAPKKIQKFLQELSIMGHTLTGKIKYNNIKPTDIQNILYQLKNEKDYPMLNKKLLRCMQKAVYDFINIGHFGLASNDYTHFTSPIRRYSDLKLHQLINEFIFEKNNGKDFKDYIANSLPYITEHISATERIADDCEYAVNDMKIAEYMEGIKDENGNIIKEGHIGEEYEAVIDGMLKNGFFVETNNLINGLVKLETLEDYLVFREELLAYTNKKKQVVYRLGDKVVVKCIGASKTLRTVDFTLVKRDKDGDRKQKSTL